MIHIQMEENVEAHGMRPDGSAPVDVQVLEQAAGLTLQHMKAEPEVEVTLVLTGDRQLHQLNQQYLGIDAPTDVLSFPGGDTDPDTQTLYLGDIIISVPRAQAQAAAGGHPLTAELQLLVVHGMLHLLGYDHAEDAEKAAMWAAQAEILQLLGSSITGPAG